MKIFVCCYALQRETLIYKIEEGILWQLLKKSVIVGSFLKYAQAVSSILVVLLYLSKSWQARRSNWICHKKAFGKNYKIDVSWYKGNVINRCGIYVIMLGYRFCCLMKSNHNRNISLLSAVIGFFQIVLPSYTLWQTLTSMN